jgi:preprotein translocase subunit YajC
MTPAFILLQAAGGGLVSSLLPFVLIIVVMYLFFLRPQMKKQKEEAKFKDTLTKGMTVVTHSGIHGKILDLQDDTITLESENTRLKVEKTAVSKELSASRYPAVVKKED